MREGPVTVAPGGPGRSWLVRKVECGEEDEEMKAESSGWTWCLEHRWRLLRGPGQRRENAGIAWETKTMWGCGDRDSDA